MKICFFKTDKKVPFDSFYRNFGTDSLFISNIEAKFENNKSQLKILFYDNIENNTLIFIDIKLKNKFFELIKDLLSDNIKWSEIQKPSKLSIKELGIINKNDLYLFYDQIELQEAIDNRGIKSMSKLQDKMDYIVDTDNGIDFVFFATVGENGDGEIIEFSKEHPEHKFDGDSINKFLHAIEKIEIIKNFGKGELEFSLFQFKNKQNNDGGFLCVSIVPNSNPKLWLGFVNANPKNQTRFMSFRKTYLEELHELSRECMQAFYKKK